MTMMDGSMKRFPYSSRVLYSIFSLSQWVYGCYRVQMVSNSSLRASLPSPQMYVFTSGFYCLIYSIHSVQSAPASISRKEFSVIHQGASSHSLWYDIKTLRWVVEPGTLFASYRRTLSHIVYSFFHQAPPHPVDSIHKLGTPSTLRSQRSFKPLRTLYIHIPSCSHLFSWRPALRQRLPRLGLHRVLYHILLLCPANYHNIALLAYCKVLWHQKAIKVGQVWWAGVCCHLFCGDGYLGHCE